MKFLAIDTSGAHLTVIAHRDGTDIVLYEEDCTLRHSVKLMDQIDRAFKEADMLPSECDFFAVVVGPGSFTGIRIGIATVKGLCFATGKPAVAVTSFDCIAYAVKGECIAVVDAGHGYVYAAGYDGELLPTMPPCYIARSDLPEGAAVYAGEAVCFPCGKVDPAEGLRNAVLQKTPLPAEELTALYIRKSSAEEKRT